MNDTFLFQIQINADKAAHQLEAQLSESNARLDEAQRQIAELSSQKSRMVQENSDLQRQLEEAESGGSALTKLRAQLAAQLDDLKRQVEEESRVSASIFFLYPNKP